MVEYRDQLHHMQVLLSVVCVRKKDGGLCLCVDYCELNKKTIPDRQPIPKVQDILDTFGGKSWFTVLDQGKAYHQGFIQRKVVT